MANYWEEQQLKQIGYASHMQSEPTATGGPTQSNLEADLANVKKSLWDVEHHTSQTQSRLDQNNKSGPKFDCVGPPVAVGSDCIWDAYPICFSCCSSQ
jgi:hypothetical protein